MPPPDVEIGPRYASCVFGEDTSIGEYFGHFRGTDFSKRQRETLYRTLIIAIAEPHDVTPRP